MFKKLLILCLAISLYACDSESNDAKEPPAESSDSTLNAGAEASDAEPPMQHYDFDTVEIEPDQDVGPDMDD